MRINIFVAISALILALGAPGASLFAQITQVDPTFNSVPSRPLTSAMSHLVQPDGKVIVYGTKTVIDGVATASIARLNSDGSRDPSFSYCDCALSSVTSARLLPDGKIVVAGREGANGKVIRLNTDGTVDPTFVVLFGGGPGFSEVLYVEAVQADGKILVMRQSFGFGNSNYSMYRYSTDGTQDSGFTAFTIAAGSNVGASVRVVLLPDGRFYIASNVTFGGSGSSATVRRRNADGSIDSTWEAPAFTTDPGFPPNVFIYDLAVTADGSVLAVGRFNMVNGLAKPNFVKLLSAGNVDVGFPVPSTGANRVYILPDGKILFGTSSRISRLNSDGSPDSTFDMDPAVESVLSRFDVDSSQRIILFAQMAVGIRLIRLLPNGGLDGTFQTFISLYGQVHSTAVQSDGKALVAGVFAHMNSIPRSSFARVNSDGSLDPTFDPHSSFNQPPQTMLVQPDGKILAIGPFTSYDGVTVPGLVRINADGTRDATFNPIVSSQPLGIALEADGQILISGSFNQVNGATRTGLARLNADGTLDTTFNPVIGTSSINAVIAEADGKIVIGGSFSGVNGFNRTNLARLLNDGSTDPSLTATGVTPPNILVRQPDGKYLLANLDTLARYHGDGSRDLGFAAPFFSASDNRRIDAIALQPDGSIIVGGRFDKVGSADRANIARLSPTGAFDVLFLQGGTDGRVRTISQYSSSKIILGGEFSIINRVMKPGIARVDVAPFHGRTPFDFDGDGRADISVFRPSTNRWYEVYSSTGAPYEETFGSAGDILAPADFDGDGITDEAIFRPSTGTWWYRSSASGALRAVQWGVSGDIPRPSDWDGDGKTDFVVFRPSNNNWFRLGSAGQTTGRVFGQAGDQPLVGDFDGDGKSDYAVFRPSTGDWWYAASSAFDAFRQTHWGQNGDIPVPADYDGDGKTDFAVFRPSDGGWYIYNSSNGSFTTTAFGLNGDRPVAADYDGDGKADIAVFRPSTGIWYLLRSTSGFAGYQFGISTDTAIPAALIP